MKCQHCKKELDSGLERLEGNVSHFECAFEYVNGEKWKEPEWLKEMKMKEINKSN